MKDHINQVTGKPFPRGAQPTPPEVKTAAAPFEAYVETLPDHFFIFPRKLSMWLNDQYGDCVTAEEAFNKAANGIFIEDNTVLKWCEANGVLNGANLEPVIRQMQRSGFSQDSNVYGDGAPQLVDYQDADMLQAAIYQAGQHGGTIKIDNAADALPSGAGNHNGWWMTARDTSGSSDHCCSLCGYGTAQQFCDAMKAAYGLSLTVPSGVSPTLQGYAFFTWSTIGFVSVPALLGMTTEAWIRNPNSVNKGTGTPNPDPVYTTEEPTPPPPPPPPPHPGGNVICITETLQPGTYNITRAAAAEGATITIPPWLLVILRQFCSTAPQLPPPWNFLAMLACGMIPPPAKKCGECKQPSMEV